MNKMLIPSAVKEYIETEKYAHDQGNIRRGEVDPLIQESLMETMIDTHCDRSYIMEMHNGVSNPTGLPFRYCEMTYEQINSKYDNVRDEYDKVNMSRYPIFSYLAKNMFFIGTVDELAQIDKRMSERMKNNDVQYLAMNMMTCNGQPVGVIGISFCQAKDFTDKDKMNIMSLMNKSSEKISSLLNENENSHIIKINL
jgi:hypothetical protein